MTEAAPASVRSKTLVNDRSADPLIAASTGLAHRPIGLWRIVTEGGRTTRHFVSRRGKPPPFDAADEEPNAVEEGELAPLTGNADRARQASDAEEVRVLGYVSVMDAGELNGAEFTQQAAAIDELCERESWTLLELVRDVEPEDGKGLERPGLVYVLERLAKGEATCLALPDLGRLTASAAELGALLDWLVNADLRLVAIEPGIDTATPEGRLAVKALQSVSRWERERLSRRTRKGLAAAREKGAKSRPSVSDRPALGKRIAAMRADGMTLQAIADTLNAEEVPTLRGGALWRPSSVQAAAGYKRRRAKRTSLPLPQVTAATEEKAAPDDGREGVTM
jgi:DNA invertase Pin-like site-specific DNA recombinase